MAKKVFVSGCYDLLHSGHVEFFLQASQYGDLYVGIGSDAPVIMGYIADTTGSMAIAFLIPLFCYGVIGGYAAMPRCSSTCVERN